MRAADVNPMNHSQLSCQSTWFLQVHTCSNIRVACRGRYSKSNPSPHRLQILRNNHPQFLH